MHICTLNKFVKQEKFIFGHGFSPLPLWNSSLLSENIPFPFALKCHQWILSLDIEFQVYSSFPSALEKLYNFLLAPVRNLHFKLFFPIGKVSFLLLVSRVFCLYFSELMVMCLGVGFILFEVHSASLTCRLMSFARLGKFSAIISSSTFSILLSQLF